MVKFLVLPLLFVFVVSSEIDATPTAHIACKKGEFGKTVLMPGDPLRAKFIAETFLDNAVLVNNVRGVQGYTGTYKGVKVSVMASGMGMPSIGIYSYELFKFYDVDNIIRIGTIGSLDKNVKVRDMIVGVGAHTDSNYELQYGLPGHVASLASYDLVKRADFISEKLGFKKKMHFGGIVSSDVFYGEKDIHLWTKIGALGVEMEANALYLNAMRLGKKALCLCTVSNNIITGEETTSEERQTSFKEMMEVALNIAVDLEINP